MSTYQNSSALYPTEADAIQGAIYDFVTSGGLNPLEDALDYLQPGELEQTIREAVTVGWTITVDGEDVVITAEQWRENAPAVAKSLATEVRS